MATRYSALQRVSLAAVILIKGKKDNSSQLTGKTFAMIHCWNKKSKLWYQIQTINMHKNSQSRHMETPSQNPHTTNWKKDLKKKQQPRIKQQLLPQQHTSSVEKKKRENIWFVSLGLRRQCCAGVGVSLRCNPTARINKEWCNISCDWSRGETVWSDSLLSWWYSINS